MKARSNLQTDRVWDDERLAAAYRAFAARPAPADLVDATLVVSAVRARQSGRGMRVIRGVAGPMLRWPRAALAGTAFGLILVTVLVAGLALRSTPAPGASAAPEGVPKTVDGLAVMTVSQALAAEAAGNPPGDGLVAIEGWFTPFPAHSCPAPMASFSPAALEDTCTSRKLLLTETKQELVVIEAAGGGTMITANPPVAPFLYAHEPAGSYVDPLLPAGGYDDPSVYRPLQAVLVGHFHDARAAECGADQRAACESSFVVDQLAWLDGKSFGPNVSIGGDSTGAVLKPRLTAEGVVAALRPSLDPSDTVVSMAAVAVVDITTITGPGMQTPGMGEDLLWFVRVAGPAPHFPPMAWGAGNSGWLVLHDATGRLRGAGGWGFASATTGSLPPSPRASLSGGLFALPTVNWLAGGLCAGVGLDAVLHGSPSDPRVAWLESSLGGPSRMEVTWPAGYRARFNPNLEVLDESGNVVIREGDAVSGACGNNPDTGMLYLEPPFK
ncbi:MAG TPA: hypothetical protein VF371_08130 [Candidatus Limnocylindrales bacterium]|jgi:hypothetical protein